ncbi:MAG: MmgE/PrpD family protein [Acidobacteriia bacterium]|nr:MmgE/PrpD family protein [Terriglobia bacterium]
MLLPLIAEYAEREQRAPLPHEVWHHAKRAVIDWFAALIPGGALEPTTMLERALAGDVGRGKSILYPSGRRATLRTAALINGTASHIVEFDDIFRDGIIHPGSPVIAAALAAAQDREIGGEPLLRAIVTGYEISTRIAMAVNPAHYKFWHTTGTVGTMGAAAAVASMLGLDREKIAHAIATSVTMAAGLQQAFRSDAMSKPLHAGHAAEAGALAALAAAEGFTGALDILEGEAGFGSAMSRGVDWSKATAGLGERYNITQMTFKNHGCCGHTFAAIDAALALRGRVEVENISRIRVATYKTAIDVTGNATPATAFEAKFSIPYTIATALVHGSVRLNAFEPSRLADSKVRDLMRRVELRVDPELDSKFPGQRAARVTIEMNNGRGFEHFQPTRKGDPDQPLSDAELNEKFLELAGGVIGVEEARGLLDELWRIDGMPRVAFLTAGRSAAR